MSLFRDIANAVREQMDLARAQAEGQVPARPTSLREAGAVGEPNEGRQRPRPPQAGQEDARASQNNVYPERSVPNDQDLRSRRRTPVQAPSRAPRSDSRTALIAALRSPASLRTAVLVREVLDPPVALRGDDSPGSGRGNPGMPKP